jgi:formyl-CoA transferase/CoA:oxalate CoA-transferase
MYFLGSGKVPGPLGSAFPTVVPYRVYAARDRNFSIAVGSERLWSAFCRAIGSSDLANDPDYSSNARRIANRHALEEKLGAIFRERDLLEWVERLNAAGIPCSPVSNFGEVAADPQTAIRQMFPTIDCPQAGPHRVTGVPVKLSETPGRIGAPAPELGEHTGEVLSDLLGLDAGEVERLVETGVVPRGRGPWGIL